MANSYLLENFGNPLANGIYTFLSNGEAAPYGDIFINGNTWLLSWDDNSGVWRIGPTLDNNAYLNWDGGDGSDPTLAPESWLPGVVTLYSPPVDSISSSSSSSASSQGLSESSSSTRGFSESSSSSHGFSESSSSSRGFSESSSSSHGLSESSSSTRGLSESSSSSHGFSESSSSQGVSESSNSSSESSRLSESSSESSSSPSSRGVSSSSQESSSSNISFNVSSSGISHSSRSLSSSSWLEGYENCDDLSMATWQVYGVKTRQLSLYSPECQTKIKNYYRFCGAKIGSKELQPKYYNQFGIRV